MKKQNFRTLFLIIATFMYLLFGAAVFDALEAKHEEKLKHKLTQEEERIQHKNNISDDDMYTLYTTFLQLKPHNAGVQWKFAGSFYFCMTVITTIGYGHSAPRTVLGRLFCMIYALCGIPLNLVMFQSVGERLNVFMAFVVKRIKRLLGFQNDDVSHTELVMLGGFMSVSATFLGAIAFTKFEEGWGFLDAYYYVFITLTTVGFGDYVALQKNNDLQENPSYVAFSILYILIALVIVASVMNLLVLRLLTLNTEDERREQEENQLQQRNHSYEMNHLHDDIERTYVDCNSHRNNVNRTASTEKDFRAFCTCSCLKKNSNNSRTNCGTYLPQNAIQNSLPLRNSQLNHFNDDDEMLVQFRESGRSSNRASI